MRLIAFAAVTFCIAGALAACGGSWPSASRTPTASETLPPGKVAQPTANPVPGAEIVSMQLVAPSQGWALTSERLAWTDDGGATWRSITPPGAQVSQIKAAFFLDAQHGWTLMVHTGPEGFSGPSVVSDYHTGDGGATWTQASFEGPPVDDPGPPILFGTLQFTDEQHGWFAGEYQTGLQGSPHLYRTSDGGATWSEAVLPADPEFIYTVGFRDAQDGWLAGNLANGQPLYVTHDGGASWQTQDVPPDALGALPTRGCQATSPTYTSPTFPDAEHGLLLALWACGAPNTTLFYVTDDGGATWQETAWLPHQLGAGLAGIVTRTTWIDASGSMLKMTTDGGAHWDEIAQDWPSLSWRPGTSLGEQFYALTIDFADQQHGWMVLQSAPTGLEHVLIATGDGGHTWKLLQP